MQDNAEIEEIKNKILELRTLKREIIEKNRKHPQKIKKNPNGKSNILRRMSSRFFNVMEHIDRKREESGLDILSLPEKTELIVRHKGWNFIQNDLVNFNKKLIEMEATINA